MGVEIPSDYSSIVQKLIADGRFRDEEEVVAEGLRLVAMRERLYQDVQAGIDDLDNGRRVEAGRVFEEARRRIKAVEDQQGQ